MVAKVLVSQKMNSVWDYWKSLSLLGSVEFYYEVIEIKHKSVSECEEICHNSLCENQCWKLHYNECVNWKRSLESNSAVYSSNVLWR